MVAGIDFALIWKSLPELFHAVEIDVGTATARIGTADQANLVSLELEGDGSACAVGDVHLAARGVGHLFDRAAEVRAKYRPNR